MRAGIFGTEGEVQAASVARELRALGADVVLIRADALEQGLPVSKLDGRTYYRGQEVDDLVGFYLRAVPSAQAPAVAEDGELRLHAEWYARQMQQRERSHFFVAWLLELQQRQVRLVNPPHAASLMQFKAFQLWRTAYPSTPTPRRPRPTGRAWSCCVATVREGRWPKSRMRRVDDGRYEYQPKRGPKVDFTAATLLRRLLALVPPRGLHLIR